MTNQEIFQEVKRRLEEDGVLYCVDSESLEAPYPVMEVKPNIHHGGISDDGCIIYGVDLFIYDDYKGHFIREINNYISFTSFRFATEEEIEAFKTHVVLTEMK